MTFGNTARQQGAIIPLAAICIVVLVSLLGLSFTILSLAATNQLASANINLIALAATEGYMSEDCSSVDGGKGSIIQCHTAKASKARERVELLLESSTRFGFEAVLDEESFTAPSRGTVSLMAGRIETDQNGTSLFRPLESNEYANAYSVTGTISSQLVELTALGAFADGIVPQFTARAIAIANPVQIVAAWDRSGSTANMTHLRPETPANGVCTPLEYKEGDPIPTIGSLPAFPFSPSGDEVVDSWEQCAWRQLQQGDSPLLELRHKSQGTLHFTSDYHTVFSVAASEEAYDLHAARLQQDIDSAAYEGGSNSTPLFASRGQSPNIDFPDPDKIREQDGLNAYFLDLHRAAGYSGPQPFGWIMDGLSAVVENLSARDIAGDKISMIGFGSTLEWSSVLNLTDPDRLMPILTSLRGDPLSNFTPPPPEAKEYAGVAASPDLTGQPLFASLGLFPRTTFTNLPLALKEANNQFATMGYTAPLGESQEGAIPASKTIFLISDFFTNCLNDSCNPDSYVLYRDAAQEMNTYVRQNLFTKKIIVSAIHIGREAHSLTVPSVVRPNSCMRPEEARAARKNLTAGIPRNPDLSASAQQAQLAADFAAARDGGAPFWDVARDVEALAQMTGGVYVPIMARANSGCSSGEDYPSQFSTCTQAQPTRITASCLEPKQQIEKALKEAYQRAQAYTVLCSSTDSCAAMTAEGPS